MYKNGISMITLIIYVVLFFVFSAFAVTMGTNINYQTLVQKGSVYVNEQMQKLQYNLVFSAKNSKTVDNISGRIVFSNNDEYYYDSVNKKIYKNGGVLVDEVESFRVLTAGELNDVPEYFLQDLDPNIDNLCVEVKFKKYGKELSSKLFVSAGDGLNV